MLQAEAQGALQVGYSPEVVRQLAEAEAARGGKHTDPKSLKDLEKQMVRNEPPLLAVEGNTYAVQHKSHGGRRVAAGTDSREGKAGGH